MLIFSANEHLTNLLAYGSYPLDVADLSESDEIFKQLVYIDYQLHLLIESDFNKNTVIPIERGTNARLNELIRIADELRGTVENYELNLSLEEQNYFNTITYHLYYLNSDFFQVERSTKAFINPGSITPFSVYLNVRFNVLLGCTYHHLKQVDRSLRIFFQTLSNNKYPGSSNLSALKWLQILYTSLSLAVVRPSFSSLEVDITNRLNLISFSSYLIHNNLVEEQFSKDFHNHVAQLERTYVDKFEFPSANESNHELEEFINVLGNIWSDYKTKIDVQWLRKLILKTIKKTYQSHIVMKQWIKILISLEESEEVLAAVNIYIDYVEREEAQEGYIHDILGAIETCSNALSHLTPSRVTNSRKANKNINLLDSLKKLASSVEKYLSKFSEACEIKYDENEADFLSFLYVRPNSTFDLNKVLYKSWCSLSSFQLHLAKLSTDSSSLNSDLNRAVMFQKNGLLLNCTNSKQLLNYALLLSYLRNIKEATKLLKFQMKKFPNDYQGWNLLALLLSTDEDKTDSEKIVNYAIGLSNTYLEETPDVDQLSTNEKYSILQLKLTQLAIVEATYDTRTAVDLLPEVFTLFHRLFVNILNKDTHTRNGDSAVRSMVGDVLDASAIAPATSNKWSHRPSFVDPTDVNNIIQNNGTHTSPKSASKKLIKNLSVNRHSISSRGHRKTLSMTSTTSTSTSAPYPFKKNVSTERKILQEIWLWTASLYRRDGDFDASEQAIVESELSWIPTAESHTELGILASVSRKFLSLQEFEVALESDEANVKAILGLSQIFIGDEENASLFISEKDKFAALARVKNHLEILSTGFSGWKNSEVWWLLSRIYEYFGDQVKLKEALWNCVKLEDNRPVRDFCVCEDY